jgi:hypothetical protein
MCLLANSDLFHRRMYEIRWLIRDNIFAYNEQVEPYYSDVNLHNTA